MNDNFSLRATLKSDEELHYCIDNREKYLPETVEAAVAELQSRGETFSTEELTVIAEDMQARRELAASGTDNLMMYTNETHTQIEDPDAPSFYSKRAILVFSVIFSIFFGSIMLAINVSKTQYRSMAILVALCGLGFTIAAVLLAGILNLNAFFSVFIGWGGAYLMDSIFWKRYIGNSTLYRVKSIVGPVICGVVFAAVVIILVLIAYYYPKALNL